MVCIGFVFVALVAPLEFTKHDKMIKRSSAATCKRVYNGCLSKLIRKGQRNYHALCR